MTCNCLTGPCSSITGMCPPGGCKNGWQGDSCDKGKRLFFRLATTYLFYFNRRYMLALLWPLSMFLSCHTIKCLIISNRFIISGLKDANTCSMMMNLWLYQLIRPTFLNLNYKKKHAPAFSIYYELKGCIYGCKESFIFLLLIIVYSLFLINSLILL